MASKKHYRQIEDEDLSSLRRFLADPVSKQALSRLKKKDKKLGALLERIEVSVRDGSFLGPTPSDADEALLEQVFGKPTEDEQKETDAKLEKWLSDFREVEEQFSAEWLEKTGEAPPIIRTDEDVDKVIAWWKEKAALAGIDTDAILAAKDHEVFAWEPVIKGRMTLIRLQAAMLADTCVKATPTEDAERAATADSTAGRTAAPEGEYSPAMSKAKMMKRLGMTRKVFNWLAKKYGMIHVSRQRHMIRLDTMPEDMAKKLRVEEPSTRKKRPK